MIKKRNVFILIILIVNVILLIVLLNKTANMQNNNGQGAEIGQTISDNVDDRYSLVLNNKLLPTNHHTFEKKYDGKINVNNVYIKLKALNDYIIKMADNLEFYKNVDIQYYNENSSYIRTVTTIDNFQTYKKLIDMIPKTENIEKLKICRVVFDLETYKKQQNNVECNMEIEYSSGEKIKFILQINEKNNTFEFVF